MQTQKTQKPLRLNYNVPTRFVAQIRVIAAQKGVEPTYWLYKVLEAAIAEEDKSA